ncbi:hypothetical protein CASFOL_031724 [Castilleja foliolosa]|uniref:NADH:ubiquinone reductase (non-electrogenic) n=1 Tax=Castilleja foliolosa TaxID=1961234 RepID=A0ABD3C5I7_9LAMI
MKNLPATAQDAAQQGSYLADCFNRMEECEKNPEGPLWFTGEGRHRFHPFRVHAFWSICSIGRIANGCPASRRLGSDWTQHSVALVFFVCQLVSWHTRALVISDWGRRFIFRRDSSGI